MDHLSVFSGFCAGAIIHPIMLNRLFNGPIGFHNGVRISAALNVTLLLAANFMCKTRLPPKKSKSRLQLLDFVRDPPYVLLVIWSVSFVFGHQSKDSYKPNQHILDVLRFVLPLLLHSTRRRVPQH